MASESVLREKLATCARIMNMQGLMGLFGHVSACEPERGRIYFSPTRGADKSTVKSEDLVVADLEGKVIDGKGSVPKEWPIHTAVHRARPDVLAVARLHSPYSTLFAVANCPYRPVTLQGAIFGAGISVFREPHLITTPALGEKVAKLMGKKRAWHYFTQLEARWDRQPTTGIGLFV